VHRVDGGGRAVVTRREDLDRHPAPMARYGGDAVAHDADGDLEKLGLALVVHGCVAGVDAEAHRRTGLHVLAGVAVDEADARLVEDDALQAAAAVRHAGSLSCRRIRAANRADRPQLSYQRGFGAPGAAG
jgi:hypothetical protein